MEYLDFQLEIGQGSGREYPVAVIRSPAGEAREIMRFPYDKSVLQNRLQSLEIALLRSVGGRRSARSPEEQTVQDFGNDLFEALISGEVRSRFDISLNIAREQGKGLRFKLQFQAPELAALPWEFLYDQRRGEYLCLSSNTPIVRYLELFTPIPALTVTPPLRILGMIASPEDLPRLDVAREKERIETAVRDLTKQGILEISWLPGQTWQDLLKAMRAGPWHVFYFAGHSGFDRNSDEGGLALADEKGRNQLLPATQVSRLLADQYSLRLVFLNSIETAKGGKLDIYSSTAGLLVRFGIPAVLTMQYEMGDRATFEFSRVFYEALADGLPIDASVTEARIAVNLAVQNTLEWGAPVLYTRSPDCVLFDFVEVSAPPTDHPTSVGAGGTAASPPPETPPPKVEPGHLWVETKPREATVAILNIQAEFTQGLELEPGTYELEVLADGYETKRMWVELAAGEEKLFNIALSKLKAHPPPKVEPGHLWVKTKPREATVSFLNIQAEFTQGLELAPGRYEVEVSADGYETKREWVELAAGEERHFNIALSKLKAHLWVETDPPDAKVTILNLDTEFTQGLELAPGRYEVEVSADGHEMKREWVELAAGEERHVKITLAGLKARLWVETIPPGAKVSFLNPDTEFTQGLELAPGTYEVEVSADRFKPKRKWIELGPGEWKHVGFDLYPEATLAGWDRIEILKGDLLTQQVDAIVFSTSPDLGFEGSIGKQLRQRLGEEFLSKVRSQGRPPLGGVLVTEAGSLPARYIILTPIVESDRPATLETVAQGAAAAMAATATLKEVHTLAFATMGVSDGLDQHQVARLLLTTAISYLEQQVRLVRVLFVLSDQESYDTYQAAYRELAAKAHPPLPGFERLSKSSQAAWRWAEAFRQRVDAREVHTEYLLAGLYQGPTGPTRQLLTLFEDKATVQAELETLVNEMTGTGLHFPDIGPQTPDLPQNLSANLQAALLRAAEAADAQGSKSISPRHLLAGILAMPEGRAARWIVDRLQVDRETLFRLIAHGADVQLPLEEIRRASTRKPGAAQFSAGNAYALVVGIGNYLEETPIPTAAKNAQSVYAVLTDPLYCGYPPQNVRLLLDREATRSNLGQALQDIIKRSNQDSTIFFYFSGHTSEKSLSETAWSGIDMLPKHILAGNVVLVLDYCGPKTRFSMDPIEYLKKKKMALKDPDILNWLLIFSSLADEKAYKLPGSENSILTHYLIEALRGNVVSQDGLIRAEDLYTYIQERVRAETEYTLRPGPVLQDIQSGNFPLALWKGGIIETPAPSYRLFLATERANYTVGERIEVQIELQAATADSPGAFELPAGTGELHCFAASSTGLQVIEPGAASIILTPDSEQQRSATIKLKATLPGSRSCSFNLFADDRRLAVEGSSIAVEVSPPGAGEERPAILPILDVRVAARPEFVLQVELEQPPGDVVPQHLTYRLSSRVPDLQVENEVVGKVVLQPADLKRIQALVYRTVQSAAGLQPEDVRERMISLGRYLYDHLFPAREAGTWRSYLWQAEAVWQERRRAGKLPPTWLIIEDEGVWLPWELVVPYRTEEAAPGFLAERYLLSRWIEGLGRPLYGEVPMGEVALTHYKALEPGAEELDEELNAWRALLKAAGVEGILNVVKPDTPVYGLHILRHVDQLTSQLDIRPRDGARRARTPEEEMLRAQLDLRAKRPVVTLSIIDKPDQSSSVTTGGWILPDRVMPFLRAGASAVSGPWWPTGEAADQAFWTTFYDLLEGGMGLGEAVWRARLAVQRELPDRPDWLAYTLFGDPRAAPYLPEASAGYATLECLNPDEPLRPGKAYRFRATLGCRPPQWYRDRLVVAEAPPDHLRALFLAPTMQTALPEPVTMQPVSRMLRQATVELTPTAAGQHPLLAQILQGDEHLKTLQLSLIVGEETRGGQANG